MDAVALYSVLALVALALVLGVTLRERGPRWARVGGLYRRRRWRRSWAEVAIDVSVTAPHGTVITHGAKMRNPSGITVEVVWPWWRRALFRVGVRWAAGPFAVVPGKRLVLRVREVR